MRRQTKLLAHTALFALFAVIAVMASVELYTPALVAVALALAVALYLLLDIRRRLQDDAPHWQEMGPMIASLARDVGKLLASNRVARKHAEQARSESSSIGSQVRSTRALIERLLDDTQRVAEGDSDSERARELKVESLTLEIRSELKLLKDELAASEERERKERNSIETMLVRLSHEPVIQIQALGQLHHRLGDAVYGLPLLGGWAIDPSTALFIADEIEERRPGLVVECGAGSSTVWIAEMLRQRGEGQLISIEHDARYVEEVRGMLAGRGLSDWAEIRYAPLVAEAGGLKNIHWYDTSAFMDIPAIDLLLVDGPPGATGRHARYPALPLLESRLSPGVRIILDDARRLEERQIVVRWQKQGLVTRRVKRMQSAVVLERPAESKDL